MTIFICGDSTAASYAPERAPITGWGQVLCEMLPGVAVKNHAMAGRSTKSFLAEGRLIAIEREIAPGDLLLIQFTHNDYSPLCWRHTDVGSSFENNLTIFVETARLYGAQPVLLTPIPVRSWQDGQLQQSHGDYPEAVRRLAAALRVPLIDVYAQGVAYLQKAGEQDSLRMHMHVEKGVYADYPNGAQDNVHTRRHGAEVYARIVADGLQRLGLV